jgi:nucleotide-binding universal stress UspA family protein
VIHKILVPVNCSDDISRHVFQEALDLAKATGASLKLLHVLAVDEKDSPSIFALINTPENKKRWEEFERPGQELLQTLVAEAIAAGVPSEYSQDLGRPGYVICDTAKSWGADLIVMGRRGLAGLGELLLGSVSNYVAHYAPCSVMTVYSSCSVNSAPSPKNRRVTMV